jgi:hypothetical protein
MVLAELCYGVFVGGEVVDMIDSDARLKPSESRRRIKKEERGMILRHQLSYRLSYRDPTMMGAPFVSGRSVDFGNDATCKAHVRAHPCLQPCLHPFFTLPSSLSSFSESITLRSCSVLETRLRPTSTSVWALNWNTPRSRNCAAGKWPFFPISAG